MQSIVLILKGILIGIGKILPGVSGGMIAISLGIYEKAINSINNLFKEFRKNTVFLLLLGIGIFIALVFSSNIILKLLKNHYFPTMLFFIALILGGIKEAKKEINKKSYLAMFITILVIIIIQFLITNIHFNYSKGFIYYMIMGIIEAITMIVPGISGTAIFMMLGCYETIICLFSDFTHFYISTYNLSILIPFAIGIIIGTVIIVRLVSYLFKNFKNITYNVIYAFSILTVLILGLNCLNSNYTFNELIIGVVTFAIGYFIMKKINL